MRVGILDLATVAAHQTPAEALHDTLTLAQHAESLGYSRYWLAEHHAGSAYACPELLTCAVAGVTEHIRVGAAGVLLSYYSPLKVAETFLALEAMFPGRIDLGLARGRVGDAELESALLDGRDEEMHDIDVYERKIAALDRHLASAGLGAAAPLGIAAPPRWVLGSSGRSASLARRWSHSYSHAVFFSPTGDRAPILSELAVLERDDASFNVALAGSCVDTIIDNPFIHPSAVGCPTHCADAVYDLMERTGAREIIFADVSAGLNAKCESLYRLANALGLNSSLGDTP
jgi:alkanesulfonate monooxygenase SsuD/methylene tetrahydromethanopterin reductase-like flavin-dependent oxidoreductase (luciferase family)